MIITHTWLWSAPMQTGDVLTIISVAMTDCQWVWCGMCLDLKARHNVRITMSLAASCCATTNQVWSVWLRSPALGLSENQSWLSGFDGWQLLVTSLVTVDLLANSQRSQRNLNTKLRPSYNHITDPTSTLAARSHHAMGHSNKFIIFGNFFTFIVKVHKVLGNWSRDSSHSTFKCLRFGKKLLLLFRFVSAEDELF